MKLFKGTILVVFICTILFFVSGCRGTLPVNYYINPDIDFSFFKKVAVMPLENLTNDKSAGEIVRHMVISELLASGLVDVVIPGEVMAVVNDLGIQNIASLNARQINALGKALNVEAIIMGSVEQYGEVRSGNVSAPEVTFTLLMAETGTGNVIWSITTTSGGASFAARHFGARSKTMSETLLTVVRKAINTLVGN
jgi:hypothetical protein